MCPSVSVSFPAFRNHYVRVNQHDSHFSVTCSIKACAYTTKNWGNFKVYLSSKHRREELNIMEGADGDNAEIAEEVRASLPFDKDHFNAMYTLSLQSEHNLPVI